MVVHRSDSNYDEALGQIVDGLTASIEMPHDIMALVREHARKTARVASWSNFIKHYKAAYTQAVSAARQRTR